MQAQATLLMPGIDRITGLSFSIMALICFSVFLICSSSSSIEEISCEI